MEVRFDCPVCQVPGRQDLSDSTSELACPNCHWKRPIPDTAIENTLPRKCVACGCDDLWRQKDFPQGLGLIMVGLGMLFSTIAWFNYRPVWAISILMGFALIDMLLYLFMSDMLVCYRCRSRFRHANLNDELPRFDLETAERYRQESIRLKESQQK